MPTYEFKCVNGGETTARKMTVEEYVDLKEYRPPGESGVFCFKHKSQCRRVFSAFTFRI